MNIYLVKRTDRHDYDEFDSFVVIADCEDQARDTNPRERWCMSQNPPCFVTERINWNEQESFRYCGWTTKRANVVVTLIGKAAPDQKFGIVCASFNAG